MPQEASIPKKVKVHLVNQEFVNLFNFNSLGTSNSVSASEKLSRSNSFSEYSRIMIKRKQFFDKNCLFPLVKNWWTRTTSNDLGLPKLDSVTDYQSHIKHHKLVSFKQLA